MTDIWHHEKILRGNDAMTKLAACKIGVCGAGAIGSNLVQNLARMGCLNLTVIDKDRVEKHNIGTQVYSLEDIGARKAECLRNLIFRDTEVEISAIVKELTFSNVEKLLSSFDVIVDAFDNSGSRQAIFDYVRSTGQACLHAGLNDSYGEVRWNQSYVVPGPANDDVCDYPLARNLIMMVVALTSEAIIRHCLHNEQLNLSVTFDDLSVNIDAK